MEQNYLPPKLWTTIASNKLIRLLILQSFLKITTCIMTHGTSEFILLPVIKTAWTTTWQEARLFHDYKKYVSGAKLWKLPLGVTFHAILFAVSETTSMTEQEAQIQDQSILTSRLWAQASLDLLLVWNLEIRKHKEILEHISEKKYDVTQQKQT